MYKAEVIERPSRKIVQFILLALRTVYKYINISKRNSIENLGFIIRKKIQLRIRVNIKHTTMHDNHLSPKTIVKSFKNTYFKRASL